MEGLRALPWFREMLRRGSLAIGDCGRCKATTGKVPRQWLACGYEPAIEQARAWQPPSGRNGFDGPPLTVCAGYSCRLPEVTETALARVHWASGNAAMLDLSEDGRDAVVILESAHNQLQAWIMTPADGGGKP